MKTSRQHHDSAADEQAALWAARLDGDNLDRAQRAELDAWLAQDPAHRTLLSRYCQLSADLEEQIPALVAAGKVSLPASRRPRWRWTFPRVASLALAAAAAVAITVTVMRPAPQEQNVATSPGQRDAETLADGSRVELNANTSLRFDNSKTERRVRFAGGEALFMVAKDPSRPFYVDTPAGSVRVTGTTFNVRTGPTDAALEVTVVEGSVQVRPNEFDGARPAGPVALGANDQFTARDGSMTTQSLSAEQLDDALAWRDGKIVFRKTPLRDALARFARFHGRSITAADSLANEPIGGRYSIDDLNGFLDALELMLPVKVNRALSGAVTVGPRTRG